VRNLIFSDVIFFQYYQPTAGKFLIHLGSGGVLGLGHRVPVGCGEVNVSSRDPTGMPQLLPALGGGVE